MKKDKRFLISLSEVDLERIEKLANHRELSMSALIRFCVKEMYEKEIATKSKIHVN